MKDPEKYGKKEKKKETKKEENIKSHQMSEEEEFAFFLHMKDHIKERVQVNQ